MYMLFKVAEATREVSSFTSGNIDTFNRWLNELVLISRNYDWGRLNQSQSQTFSYAIAIPTISASSSPRWELRFWLPWRAQQISNPLDINCSTKRYLYFTHALVFVIWMAVQLFVESAVLISVFISIWIAPTRLHGWLDTRSSRSQKRWILVTYATGSGPRNPLKGVVQK